MCALGSTIDHMKHMHMYSIFYAHAHAHTHVNWGELDDEPFFVIVCMIVFNLCTEWNCSLIWTWLSSLCCMCGLLTKGETPLDQKQVYTTCQQPLICTTSVLVIPWSVTATMSAAVDKKAHNI